MTKFLMLLAPLIAVCMNMLIAVGIAVSVLSLAVSAYKADTNKCGVEFNIDKFIYGEMFCEKQKSD